MPIWRALFILFTLFPALAQAQISYTPSDYKRASTRISKWFVLGTSNTVVQSASPLGRMPTFFQTGSGMPYNLGFEFGYIHHRHGVSEKIRNSYDVFGGDGDKLTTEQVSWHRLSLTKALSFRNDLNLSYLFEPLIKLQGFGVGWKWNFYQPNRLLHTSIVFNYEQSKIQDTLATKGGHVDLLQSITLSGLQLYAGVRYFRHEVSFEPQDSSVAIDSQKVTATQNLVGGLFNASPSLTMGMEYMGQGEEKSILFKLSFRVRSNMKTPFSPRIFREQW